MAGAIGGGAFALILLALFIGLGSASVAVIGSIEWKEYRDRKNPGEKEGDGGKMQDRENNKETAGQEAQSITTMSAGETVTGDPEKVEIQKEPPRKARLTLKSFLPLDFQPTWLPSLGKS